MRIAFSPSVPLLSSRPTGRQAAVKICMSQETNSVRAASAACAALLAAHVLVTPATAVTLPVAFLSATATPAAPTAPADAPSTATPPSEETLAEARTRSARNTRTSGASSRLFSQAMRAASAGDLQSAEAMYAELTTLAPDFAPAYSNLGNLLVARKEYAAAEAQYSRALDLAPRARDSWLILVNRGAARLARGEGRAALADMDAADALEPRQAAVLSNRGTVWEALGKYENAARDYQTALEIDGDVQPFWLRYGLVLFQKGLSFEAMSVLNRVNARFGGDDAAAAQAVVFFDRNDLAAAEGAWSRVERPRLYETTEFLAGERKWPPKAVEAMQRFRGAK